MKVRAPFSLIFLVILFLTNVINAKNENLFTPNNNAAVKIESYESVWTQTVTEPNGKTRKGINTISDSVQVKSAKDGTKTIQRSVKWTDTNNNWYIKTDLLDYITLKPLSIDIRWNPNYVQHTDIKGKNLVSTSLKNQFSTSKLTMFQLKDIGYTWSSDGFMLNVVGKLADKKFSLQTLNNLPHSPTIGKKDFELIGSEKIEINNIGNFDTRIFKTIDNGNIVATYWLANKKPYIVKVRFVQLNNQITVWNLNSVK